MNYQGIALWSDVTTIIFTQNGWFATLYHEKILVFGPNSEAQCVPRFAEIPDEKVTFIEWSGRILTYSVQGSLEKVQCEIPLRDWEMQKSLDTALVLPNVRGQNIPKDRISNYYGLLYEKFNLKKMPEELEPIISPDQNLLKSWPQNRDRLPNIPGDLIRSGAFSPDNKLLACGLGGKNCGVIHIWDIERGEKCRTLRGHSNTVTSVTFSPNGEKLASGSCDKSVQIWDVRTGTIFLTLMDHSGEVYSVEFSPDGNLVASSSADKTIRLWDAKTGIVRQRLLDTQKVAFSPNSKLLVSGSADGNVRIWDVATGEIYRTLQGHSEGLNAFAFSPDGELVVSRSSNDNGVWVWDVESGALYHQLKSKDLDRIQVVSFSQDGKLVMSGGKTIDIWDLETGKRKKKVFLETEDITWIAFSQNSRVVAYGLLGTLYLLII